MSETTNPQRPALIEDTKPLTPWWKRPSNGALVLAGVMAVSAEFPRFAEQIAPFVRDDWRSGLRLASLACTFLAVVLVRLGVTRADQKAEKIAERVPAVVEAKVAEERAASATATPEQREIAARQTVERYRQEADAAHERETRLRERLGEEIL